MATFVENLVENAFQLAYEVSPIILTNGIASTFGLGGLLPIITLTEMLDLPGLQSGEYFAHFKPLPGSTLIDYQVAEYPLANLTVAANAVIQEPLKISMLMVCPAQNHGGYILKQAQISMIQTLIQKHIQAAGTFTVITPAFTYTNCLLVAIRDVTPPSDKQVQFMYQWDFVQPLVSSSPLASLGTLMSDVASGVATSVGSWF